jgi:hypothetical protein
MPTPPAPRDCRADGARFPHRSRPCLRGHREAEQPRRIHFRDPLPGPAAVTPGEPGRWFLVPGSPSKRAMPPATFPPENLSCHTLVPSPARVSSPRPRASWAGRCS